MKRLILLMVMFATCCAKPEDLSGKVFVFPKETKTDHVKLQTSQTEFSSVTACLRFQTDLTRNYGLFSLATTAHSNAFLLFKKDSVDVIDVEAKNGKADLGSLSFPQNIWHSVCATWRSDNGVAQVWMDGKATVKRFIKTGAITGAPITILGQEQDAYGGNFDETQSFIGMITDVHMWDQVLPASEIKRYMAFKHFTPGNVFNWGALEYDIIGDILVEEESEVM